MMAYGVAAVAGVLTWTLLEYVIHRWAGHVYKRNFFGTEHTRHHREGDYFAAAWKKGIAAVVVLLVLTNAVGLWLGWGVGFTYAGGLTGFYLTYEWLHRREHTHAPANAYGRWARRHHFWHHFGNPKVNHGVTSPVWDLVFGTYVRPEQIRVPRAMAMPWLLDARGELRAEYATDYTLRGKHRVKGSARPVGAPALH